MNNSEETSEQETQTDTILQAIAELSNKIDDYKLELSNKIDDYKLELSNKIDDYKLELSNKMDDYKLESDAQFEAIRQGVVHNSVSFDRLKAEVLLLRADVKELTEETRQNKKILV